MDQEMFVLGVAILAVLVMVGAAAALVFRVWRRVPLDCAPPPPAFRPPPPPAFRARDVAAVSLATAGAAGLAASVAARRRADADPVLDDGLLVGVGFMSAVCGGGTGGADAVCGSGGVVSCEQPARVEDAGCWASDAGCSE